MTSMFSMNIFPSQKSHHSIYQFIIIVNNITCTKKNLLAQMRNLLLYDILQYRRN